MKLILTSLFSLLIWNTSLGQVDTSKPNAFLTYEEFKTNTPSVTFGFELKKKTGGMIFMNGGIENYVTQMVSPKSDYEKIDKKFWGVIYNDTIYINSYRYSKLIGYNQVIEKGYYTYFIGETAHAEAEQRKLGFIKPDEERIDIAGKTGYVILPDGTVKLLRPELLLELCMDNEGIAAEIKAAGLALKDVYRMFAFLKQYNATKI